MPLAIQAGEELVGFAMFGRDDSTGQCWIMRYMIDVAHQSKGYGTAALSGLLDLMVERHGCREVFLDYASGNEIAGRLYARAGFVPTREEAGAIEARLDLTGRGLIRDPGDNRRRPGELPTDAPSPQHPAADA